MGASHSKPVPRVYLDFVVSEPMFREALAVNRLPKGTRHRSTFRRSLTGRETLLAKPWFPEAQTKMCRRPCNAGQGLGHRLLTGTLHNRYSRIRIGDRKS